MNMRPSSKYSVGPRFGLITGFLYVGLLFLRYKFFAFTPRSFYFAALISYLVILLMYLIAGIARKKELGGSAEIKEIFKSIFIVILVTELMYLLFNFIYLKFVDPGFQGNFHEISLAYYKNLGYSSDQIEMEMKAVKVMSDAVKPEGLLKGFGAIIVVDSIFGFIFAAVLSRKKPILEKTKL
jgi:hypothetical protein